MDAGPHNMATARPSRWRRIRDSDIMYSFLRSRLVMVAAVLTAILVVAGWTFLNAWVSWVYIAAFIAFELWLLRAMKAAGKAAAPVGEPP